MQNKLKSNALELANITHVLHYSHSAVVPCLTLRNPESVRHRKKAEPTYQTLMSACSVEH